MREVVRHDVIGAANWEVLFVALLLACCLYFAAWSVLRVRGRDRPITRDDGLPLVALGAVAVIPFLTLDLWRNIPSYSRYGAPVAGLLVLAYAIDRGFMPKLLLTATATLSLTNPIIALLPTDVGRVIEPTPPATPTQARASELSGCIGDAGVVARVSASLSKPGSTVLSLTTRSGLPGSITVFESEGEATQATGPALDLIKAAGGEGGRVGDLLLLWPKGINAPDDRRVRDCMR